MSACSNRAAGATCSAAAIFKSTPVTANDCGSRVSQPRWRPFLQELSTAVQYGAPVKVFILNNEWMGMVRQWQELLHEERYAHSYSAALPDFVKLAEAYGGVGIRAEKPEELDEAIAEMLRVDKPVLFDCRVERAENCLPMIPSGKAHNEMILPDFTGDLSTAIDASGRGLV